MAILPHQGTFGSVWGQYIIGAWRVQCAATRHRTGLLNQELLCPNVHRAEEAAFKAQSVSVQHHTKGTSPGHLSHCGLRRGLSCCWLSDWDVAGCEKGQKYRRSPSPGTAPLWPERSSYDLGHSSNVKYHWKVEVETQQSSNFYHMRRLFQGQSLILGAENVCRVCSLNSICHDCSLL